MEVVKGNRYWGLETGTAVIKGQGTDIGSPR